MSKSRQCTLSSCTLSSSTSNQPICRPLAAAITLVFGTAAHATTFTVVNTNDNGSGSLREAVIDANTSPGADNIVFDSALKNSTITLTTGEIQISDELTITGIGDANSITIDGNHASRLFNVNKPRLNGIRQVAPLTLENVTLTGGKSRSGAALRSNGPVTLNNSVITGNSPAPEPGEPYYGNTVWAYGDVTFNQSMITGNSAGGNMAYVGNITLNQSTVSQNRFGVLAGGSVTLNQSTISENSGRGVSTVFGNVMLNQSTVSGNTGDGINAQYGNVNLKESTVSGNQGVGIYVGSNSMYLNQSTVTNNMSGGIESVPYSDGSSFSSYYSRVTLKNTIVANNTGSGGNFYAGLPTRNNSTVTLHASFSVFGDDASEINGTNTSNIFSNSPGLGLLQNNGGPTQTHLPDIGSPVLDVGNNADVPDNFDQRGNGFPRIVNGTVDIGAVERQAVAQPIPILSLPALLSLIASFVALVGWQQRSS